MPDEKAKGKRATKATAANLRKSKEEFAVEFTIRRGDKTFKLALQPLEPDARKRILAEKPPTAAAMLLPELDEQGYVMETGKKIFRYPAKGDMMYPKTPPEVQKAFEEYEAKLEGWQTRISNRGVFYTLPKEMRKEFLDEYQQETDENIGKFLNAVFLAGELDALYGMYDQLTNAVGVEYGPFSTADFLNRLGDGNLPNSD